MVILDLIPRVYLASLAMLSTARYKIMEQYKYRLQKVALR
jgi:hypothetical protein